MIHKRKEVQTHPCSSCDDVVSVDEIDSCGRCQRCQEEYPLEDGEYDYEE